MTIPHENALAFFPRSVTAGNLALGPLTLSGAVLLAERGIEIGRRVPKEKLFEAAWVLGGTRSVASVATRTGRSPSLPEFCKRAKVGLNELSNAVETVLNDASATFVKPAAGKIPTVSANPKGLGWPLEYAEFLCAEYGWDFETAIHTPVATVYALYAAYRKRNGGKSGMDYLERAYAKTLKKSAECGVRSAECAPSTKHQALSTRH